MIIASEYFFQSKIDWLAYLLKYIEHLLHQLVLLKSKQINKLFGMSEVLNFSFAGDFPVDDVDPDQPGF